MQVFTGYPRSIEAFEEIAIPNKDDVVSFVRAKDLIFRKELGQGACGITALLYDGVIDEHFVCKKYLPHVKEQQAELFENFKREIKILHRLNHPNVVRLFNYYLYPAKCTGFILMEFVEGKNIENYLKESPENAAEIFRQTINGFQYLEQNKVLHRDIRPDNLLVSSDSVLKIIDFGFGKQVKSSQDFEKSVTLNWACEPPAEFQHRRYDFATEVYFIGKVFSKALVSAGVVDFEYDDLLKRMCEKDPSQRVDSFESCRARLQNNRTTVNDFDEVDIFIYRSLSDHLLRAVTRIKKDARFQSTNEILKSLEVLYPKNMLEEFISSPHLVISCFISGGYFFKQKYAFPVSDVKAFLDFFRSCSEVKRSIVLANLQTKLENVERYSDEGMPPDTDDIPF